MENANGKGLVFGLSGGVDSAVVAGLAKKSFSREFTRDNYAMS